jgi:hypothetical protein
MQVESFDDRSAQKFHNIAVIESLLKNHVPLKKSIANDEVSKLRDHVHRMNLNDNDVSTS